MKLKLHHINLCSSDVPEMGKFYRDVLGMENEPTRDGIRVTQQGYSGDVAFVTDGNLEVHLAERDMNVGFKTKQAINPLERGHIAFRTDDIEAFKKQLEEKGIAYSDYGTWAMNGWHQIFFHDPEGNIIEVHQAR